MTEQVPAPVAVLGQVLSLARAGSSGINHFGTARGVSGVTRDTPAAGEWVARRR
jgi:hypothetical protein